MPNMPPPAVAGFVEGVRQSLVTATRKMVPAPIAMLDFVNGLWSFQIAYTFAELELADALAGGPRRAESIAQERGLDADHTYRLLRAASNVDIVRERPDGAFVLTDLGRAFLKDESASFRDFLVFMGRFGYPNWGRLVDCVRQGQNAIQLELGVKPFEAFGANPEMLAGFQRAMTAASNATIDAFLAIWDCSTMRRVVDVGGGHGRLLSAILGKAPQARGVLFDMPAVVEGAGPLLDSLGVRDRVERVGGDFFERVPEGGDHYTMKAILHDWQDDDAARILGSIRRAIAPGGRLLVLEAVVPGPGVKHFAKLLDIEMIVHAGGRERTRDEYAALFARSGFRLERIVPTAGPISVIEAVPV